MKSKVKFNFYKYSFSIIFLLLVIAFFLFIKNFSNPPSLEEEFEISINETISVKDTDFKIKILKIEDSRCPLNVNCFLKGQASITFNVFRDEVVLGKFVRSDKPGDTSLFLNGYRVYILEVKPYPVEPDSIEDSEYLVKMIVFKE